MKPNVADAPDTPDERLYRAANRLSIKIHGCAIDSLSRRDPEVTARLYRFAAENRRWYRERQLRAA